MTSYKTEIYNSFFQNGVQFNCIISSSAHLFFVRRHFECTGGCIANIAQTKVRLNVCKEAAKCCWMFSLEISVILTDLYGHND